MHIALMGRARSGKDTLASYLVEKHGYTRVAFADPLKEMALSVDPLISTFPDMAPVRLSRLVADVGWEYAKDHYPEVRRILQNLGQTVRGEIPGYWVGRAMRRILAIDGPVVVSDCRYPDEAAALMSAGFTSVRLVRPGVETMAHESERALSSWFSDHVIYNGGMIADMYPKVDDILGAA
jgi:hypothetical protein